MRPAHTPGILYTLYAYYVFFAKAPADLWRSFLPAACARRAGDAAVPGVYPAPMPAQTTHRAVVVGAGFGGIGMAAALRQAGLDDFLIVDRAGDLGGTWRDNTYPGLSCDIPSHLYSYSSRPGRWSRRFPPGQEILGYLHELCAERGLGPHFRFGSGVAAAEFDERRAVWHLTLEDGGTLQARAIVSAVGQLGQPRLPDIPGRAGFAGPSWHSARWDHGTSLAGRRVAVLGTGASAIQLVPEIAKTAAQVDVYQRSAPYILPKSDPWCPAGCWPRRWRCGAASSGRSATRSCAPSAPRTTCWAASGCCSPTTGTRR